MRVSIVTVCFNAEKTIRNTIESVLAQKYDDFEYVVVDGKSTDRTYDIVLEYESKFKDNNIRYIHLSEKDNGIFDAMNKAVNISNGEWVCYINADDQLYSYDVLEKAFKSDRSQFDVVYGNVFRVGNGAQYVDKASPIKNMTLAMPFCHQASFTKREFVKFDINCIVADYKLFLGLYLAGKKFLQIDETIAKYSMEGFSNQDKYKTYLEVVKVKSEFGLIKEESIGQKLKNTYHRIMLDENMIGHKLLYRINVWITDKRKNEIS